MQPFTDLTTVSEYANATPRRVPGFADLHRMAMLLIAERAPATANILVVGAGGGLELRAFAEAQPDWRFEGIDPSAEMLDLASQTLGPLEGRVKLQQGTVEAAGPGPFDGATCLLVLHFLKPEERLRTLREIKRRLKPGAPLIVAHHSCDKGEERVRWLTRSVAFAGSDADFAKASASAAIMADRLPILPPAQDEALLREAGFSEIGLFYAGFSFRGWACLA
jgi:tRNA (cmo5U34)-methyltransferase